jgi:hypothetical protein
VSASFDGRGCYCCGANWATAVTSGRASSTVATATSASTTKLVRDASTRPCSHLQLSCRGRVWHECVLHRPFAIDATACASQVFPMAGSASTSFARSIGDRYRCKLARATSLETDGTAMRRLACCWLTRPDGIAVGFLASTRSTNSRLVPWLGLRHSGASSLRSLPATGGRAAATSTRPRSPGVTAGTTARARGHQSGRGGSRQSRRLACAEPTAVLCHPILQLYCVQWFESYSGSTIYWHAESSYVCIAPHTSSSCVPCNTPVLGCHRVRTHAWLY